ncbi:MAG: dual specificity protein phosphatase family protein [Dehalococcoidia bacterium]
MRLPFRKKTPKIDLAWLTADLALGSAPIASQWDELFKAGVGAVLEIRSEGQDDVAVLEARGIPYRREEVPDHGAPTLSELYEMVQWVRAQMNQRRKVLVHCRLGLGRSAMVACATLIALGFPLDVAYSMLRKVRPNVQLSPKQVNALESLTNLVAAERRQQAAG